MKDKKILLILNIIILFILTTSISFILGRNILIFVMLLILMILVTLRLIYKPNELLVVTIIVSLFNGTLSSFASIFQFLPIYFYFLMGLILLLKFKNIEFEKNLTLLIVIVFFMGMIPYLYTEFRIIPFFIGALKKFGFIIIFLFTSNLNLERFNLNKFIVDFVPKILILNTLVSIFQFINGYRSDEVVGFLGRNMTGTIGYLLMFYLAIEFSKDYKNNNMYSKIFFPLIVTFIYAAIAEVKILFVISVLISIIYLGIRKIKIKSIIAVVLISIVTSVSYGYFIKIYPHHDFISIEFLEDYLYNESYGDESVNRLSFIDDLNDTVLDSGYARVFGTGIGSGNPSKIEMLKGSINETYDYLKYYWFTTSYLYLEGGMVGLIGYLLIYIVILCKIIKYYKKNRNDLSIIMLLFSIINIILFSYSSGLLDYSVSVIYWVVIGIGFNKTMKKNKVKLY